MAEANNKNVALAHSFMDFTTSCPTAFHVVEEAFDLVHRSSIQTKHPIKVVFEHDMSWDIEKEGLYSVDRNDSSIAFFRMPKKLDKNKPLSFKMVAAHTDSPCFKIKENPEIFENGYIRLNVEGYGGMIRESWFDRPLSIAGRVFVNEKDAVKEYLVDLRNDLKVIIPSLAIHMRNKDENNQKISIQKDMLPVIGIYNNNTKDSSVLWPLVKKATGNSNAVIMGHDLFLYCLDEPHILGANHEMLASCRIDDLACVFTSVCGFASVPEVKDNTVSILFLLDNEEVGSASKQGADSTFVSDTLERICLSCGFDKVGYMASINNSFLISADCAHAAHPAHMEKADIVNRPVLNGGVVLKYSANQKYCTDGLSAALLKKFCRDNLIELQIFNNNSDVTGGSTLGNIVLSHTSIPAVDVGIPQWAMHSAYECCGTKDLDLAEKFFSAYFAS